MHSFIPYDQFCVLCVCIQLWYLSEVFDMCAGCREPWLCGRVLSRLSQPQLEELMDSTDFSKVGSINSAKYSVQRHAHVLYMYICIHGL